MTQFGTRPLARHIPVPDRDAQILEHVEADRGMGRTPHVLNAVLAELRKKGELTTEDLVARLGAYHGISTDSVSLGASLAYNARLGRLINQKVRGIAIWRIVT